MRPILSRARVKRTAPDDSGVMDRNTHTQTGTADYWTGLAQSLAKHAALALADGQTATAENYAVRADAALSFADSLER